MRYIVRAKFTRISKSSSARGREPASTSRRCSASASETGACSRSGTSPMYHARARPTATTAGAMRESGDDNRHILLRAPERGLPNGGRRRRRNRLDQRMVLRVRSTAGFRYLGPLLALIAAAGGGGTSE